MVDFLIKLLIFTYLLLANANAESLKNIEVLGNKRISDETIKIFSNIKINDEMSNATLDKIIKNLYKTSFFKNVSLNFENQILYIQVEENPIVEDLQINGVKNKSLLEFLKDNIKAFYNEIF